MSPNVQTSLRQVFIKGNQLSTNRKPRTVKCSDHLLLCSSVSEKHRGPDSIELCIKQKVLLNNCRNEQDTSHKLYMLHGSLAGNLILVSILLLGRIPDSDKHTQDEQILRSFFAAQQCLKSRKTPGPRFHRAALSQQVLLNNCLLSRNEQDTSHKLYMLHGSLACNLILVSIILFSLATVCASWNWAQHRAAKQRILLNKFLRLAGYQSQTVLVETW